MSTGLLTQPLPETDAPSAPAPRSAGRIAGLDIARGLAVLGMVVAHVGVTSEDLGTLEGWLSVAHGRSSILFATLAGISVGILTGAARPYTGVRGLQARTRILTRSAALLAVVGVLSVLNVHIALILAYYAVWFVLALPFVRMNTRRLFVVGAAVGIAGPVLVLFLDDLLMRLGTDWYSPDGVVLQALLGTYPGLMWMGFVLVGLGVSKLDLRAARTLAKLGAAGVLCAVLGYGAGALTALDWDEYGSSSWQEESAPRSPDVGGQGTTGDGGATQTGGVRAGAGASSALPGSDVPDGSYEYDDGYTGGFTFDTSSPLPALEVLGGASPHSSTPWEFLGSGGVALAIVALCCLAPRWLRIVLTPVASVGAMSLTAYSAHVLMVYFLPGFFGTFGERGNVPLAVMVAVLLAGCTLWIHLIGRGPLEGLLRWVSMRAARIVPDAAPDSPAALFPPEAATPSMQASAAMPGSAPPWTPPNARDFARVGD